LSPGGGNERKRDQVTENCGPGNGIKGGGGGASNFILAALGGGGSHHLYAKQHENRERGLPSRKSKWGLTTDHPGYRRGRKNDRNPAGHEPVRHVVVRGAASKKPQGLLKGKGVGGAGGKP